MDVHAAFRRGAATAVMAVVAAVVFAVVACWVSITGSFPGDRRALTALHDAVGSSIDEPMAAVRTATDTVVLVVVAVVVAGTLASRRRWKDALFVLVSVGVAWAINPVLKDLFERSRPELWPHDETVSRFGFPSGHASGTAALLTATAMVIRRRSRHWVIAVGVALLVIVGFAQLALGVHYPSDIVAGWSWAFVSTALLSLFRSPIQADGPKTQRQHKRSDKRARFDC